MNTVIGKPSGEVLVTMVKRRSRFTFILKVLGKSALKVSAAILTALHPHRESVHTLTYEKGKEFAKQTDFEKITDEQIREVQNKLNDRPRKCLGWKTPREVLSGQVAIVAFPG